MKVGDRVKVEGYSKPEVSSWEGLEGVVDYIYADRSASIKFKHHASGAFDAKYLKVLSDEPKSDEKSLLPSDPKERKKYPIGTGVLDYFPAAIAEIAKVSFMGNEQHNPGQPLHWARGKSMDQADTMQRHYMERGKFDKDGVRHSAKMAWRALAILQLELEAEGYPMARGASND
jgi:hypothetical protein